MTDAPNTWHSLRAPILMTVGAAFLVVNDATVKTIGEALPISQVIAIRSVVIALTCGVIIALSRRRLSNPFNRDVLLRTAFTVGNAFAFVAAVRILPLSVAVMVDFVGILFVAASAPFLLAERLTPLRLLAVTTGLFGAALVLAPESAAIGLLVLMPVLSGALGAGRDLWTRKLGRYGPRPEELTLFAAVGMFAVAISSGLQGWTFEVPSVLGLAVAAGICQSIALILMAAAFHGGEAGLVAPFRLTSLLWALLLGYLIFGDTLSTHQMLGVLAIMSGLFLTMFSIERTNRISGH